MFYYMQIDKFIVIYATTNKSFLLNKLKILDLSTNTMYTYTYIFIFN